MLPNVAARAISGRGAPSAFRIACNLQCQRSYSSEASKTEAQGSSSEVVEDQTKSSAQDGQPINDAALIQGTRPPPKKGPYRRNRVWGPNMKIGPKVAAMQDAHRRESFSTLIQKRTFATKPPPRKTSPEPARQPQDEESLNSTTPNTEQSSSTDFESKLRGDSKGSVSNEAGSEDPDVLGGPTGPLPDLRHGIPSSLDALKADESSSFKERDSESPGLNLTEDPSESRGRNEDEGPREEYVSSIERRRNAIAYYLFIGAGVSLVTGSIYFGRNWDSEAEANSHPDAPNGYSPVAIYNRILERLRNVFGYYTEPAFEKLLPDPNPDPTLRAPYTLVLSLEDLLVSSKWDRANGYRVAKRPGVDYFLRYMSQYYELVIFTTVLPMNADTVLRKLDPFRFCIPLFRDATRYMEGEHVKDLSYLNRDLSKTIIIDTVPAHVKLQPENAILLPKWKGDGDGASRGDLVALIPFLEYIASMSIDDVRKVLKSYEGTHIPTEFHRRESLAREQFNKKLAEEKTKRSKIGGLGSLSSAIGFKPAQGMMVVPGEQTPLEGMAEGKMLSDQMRERGQKAYLEMEKQLNENGEKWLKQQEEEEKKLQEEATRNMTGWLPFFGSVSGGSSSSDDSSNRK